MKEYNYKCFDCGNKYEREEVESQLLYLCPVCGTVEKQKPLRGVLLIEYDYQSIKKRYPKEEFLKLSPGQFWKYDYLWPLEFENGSVKGVDEKSLKRISLESNCVQEFEYEGKSFNVLDDTRNPTLSFKDRASSLVVIKALQLGINKIAAASTGNAGSSLAGICSRLGLSSVIFVPQNIPEAKRIQIQSYGAEIYLVDGDYDLAFDTCFEISRKMKWYNRNTAYNPLTIEGKKSAAFDIFISTNGNMPDIIFVPTGDGVILTGVYKGLRELKELGWIEKIPKLVSVQAEGSNAVVRYMRDQKYEYKPAISVADSICAGAPRCLYLAYDALAKTHGDAVEVSEDEILDAQKIVAQKFGILLEPSSASSFAAFRRYLRDNKIDKESVMLLFTGNGLKDMSALKTWNNKPDPINALELKKSF